MRRRDDGQMPEPMAPVMETFGVGRIKRSGFLARLRPPTRQEELLTKYDDELLEAKISEALGVQLNRLRGLADYQRLVDHLKIGEATGQLAPQVADHFGRVQADIKDTIQRHQMENAKKVHQERQQWDHLLATDQISAATHERQIRSLDMIEEGIRENLIGLLDRLASKAAEDLLQTLSKLERRP
jgi:hypothetical protein